MGFERWARVSSTVAVVLGVFLVGLVGWGRGGDELLLPDAAGRWVVPRGIYVGRVPKAAGSVEVRGVGTLSFDPAQVRTLRPDLFRKGHFSVFDVLVHLAERGAVRLEYVWDETMATHRIVFLNGLPGWWYDVRYAGGENERPVLRMDHFPVKDGMTIRFYLEQPDRLAAIEQSFRGEVERRQANGGAVIVPEVTLRGPRWTLVVRDVVVEPTNSRGDVFQPGVVTALDVLLALGRRGDLLSLGLVWHGGSDSAYPEDGFVVHSLKGGGHEAPAQEGCLFVHQTGSAVLEGFLVPHSHRSSHVHLTADLEAVVSPQYVRWSWLCR